jgi:hypothetical protein
MKKIQLKIASNHHHKKNYLFCYEVIINLRNKFKFPQLKHL